MTEMCETREVIAPAVNLLHEWRFRIHQSTGSHHAMHLFDTPIGVKGVFEYSLRDNTVKRLICKRQIVGIANEHDT